MDKQITVTVEPIEGHNALRMTWQHQVDEHDVKTAFQQITQALESADAPLYIVVDLLNDPRFPLRATVGEAVKAYRHPSLAAWLIVGSNRLAKTVEATLAALTRRKNVYWFDTEPEALAYMSQDQQITDRLQNA